MKIKATLHELKHEIDLIQKRYPAFKEDPECSSVIGLSVQTN